MNKFIVSAIAALACFVGATAASAQAVTPANTSFELSGTVQFDKVGFPTQVCVLTFASNSTGPDIGGNRANVGSLSTGTNTTVSGTLCPSLTVSASDFRITTILSSGVLMGGSIDHVVVNFGPVTLCDQTNVPFTIDNLGQVTLNTTIAAGTVPGICTVQGVLQSSNALVVGVN